jgi:hypothetical protein
MPISLPTTTTEAAAADAGDSSSTAQRRKVLITRVLFPALDFSTARGKQVGAIILCRALYNFVHMFMGLGFLRSSFVFLLWHAADQCATNYCVPLIAEAEGERRVFAGRLTVVSFPPFFLLYPGQFCFQVIMGSGLVRTVMREREEYLD